MSIIDEDSTLLALSPVSGLEPVRVMVRVLVMVMVGVVTIGQG